MTDSSELASRLADYAARGLGTAENDNHSTQLAVNGLVWAYHLLAERLDKFDVLALVEDALYRTELVTGLDLTGLQALRDKLALETAI